jgi:acyl-CoA hydrolase
VGDGVFHTDVDACVDAILAQIGKKVVLGLPLGLGKANHIANALYRRAEADPSIHLSIFTALTLEKHPHGPALLQRFVGPIIERLFGAYPDLLYAQAARAGKLPANIEVAEFFLLAGQWLHVSSTQHQYISVNYSEAPRLLLSRGVNVVAQLVARRETATGTELSLSSNTDVTLDLLAELHQRRQAGQQIVLAGEVNDELPFMTGDAVLPASSFDHVLSAPAYQFPLYAPPKEAVNLTHHAIALHIAPLVKDGGTLQLGIGALADAIVWALILRHQKNAEFRVLLQRLRAGDADDSDDTRGAFVQGLYGVSEMFVDVFLDLYRAGILKRPAADGALLHGGFFLGPQDFYRSLREMPAAELEKFRMKAISFTNEISGVDEQQKRADRQDARFINNAMMATLLGEVASDTRDDGQVVSGVGGQFNFVVQAHALAGARSIIALGATRISNGAVVSNIRLTAGHVTIPRHLRDIIVTEYGAADLRGKSDRDCIAAMLNVTDSRFQAALLQQAKTAGKIEAGYEIPLACRANLPEQLEQVLAPAQQKGTLPNFPFGTDLDATEQRLAVAFDRLKALTGGKLAMIRRALASLSISPSPASQAALARIGLDHPHSLEDWITRRLLIQELERDRTAH